MIRLYASLRTGVREVDRLMKYTISTPPHGFKSVDFFQC